MNATSRWAHLAERVSAPFSSMFAKLFLTIAVVSLLVFTGMMYKSLSSSREALYNQKVADMTLFTERTGQYLDLYLQNIRNILLNVASGIDLDEQDDRKIEAVLRRYAAQNSEIVSNLFVYDRRDRLISSNQVLYEVIGHPELMNIFRIAYDNPDLINSSEPYYSPLLVDNTVAFAISLRDASGQITGIALLEINTLKLTNQLGSQLYAAGQTFALFTGKGHIVSYDRNSSLVPGKALTFPSEMTDEFAADLLGLSNGIGRAEGNRGTLITVKSNRNQLGWYLVTLTDEKAFRQGIESLYAKFAQIGAIWFALLMLLALVTSRHFTIPIRRLALQMDRIRGDRMGAAVEPLARKDEIGQLSFSFSMMMDRIRELMETERQHVERKKQLEMKLLLSQIRPHFLCNTLACIGSLAKQHRIKEVEQTIRSLIILLTSSIDKKKEIVRLEDELDGLLAYMQIQQMRYGDAFRLTLDVPQRHLQCRIPKLILQPLVENGIFHGFENKEHGTIVIRTCEVGADLHLTVEDNGKGMPPERLRLFADPAYTGELQGVERDQASGMNGMGLGNVRERIRLIYGEAYGVDVASVPGAGTKVTIRLPAIPDRPDLPEKQP
ncbi:cache domain-containing sensor histidine kinase [Paenibacillus cymbidii]|uniref:cache domain-containing sensor histidine kinase n=1 Tax=Paenibacillus cymbidii TaxID=1639034 RepID=UPI0010807FCD|nr:sensor histidine kinase [Paenibacillus cymbidii]